MNRCGTPAEVPARRRRPATRAASPRGLVRMLAAALAMLVAGSTADGRDSAGGEERAFMAAVDSVAAALVQIDPQPARESGRSSSEASPASGPSTGVIVGRHGPESNGAWIIATSFAVPGDAPQAVVRSADGTRAVATVAGRDTSRGLVLLSAARLPESPVLEPVPRGDLRPGQWTIAVGRGFGATGVSVGILSAVNRAWGRAVQTDAAVSPLNYGGPLLDIRGRVIGIIAPFPAELAGLPLGTELYDSGIGFAVPIEDVLATLPRLEAGDTLVRGILGIGYRSQDQINGEPVIGACRQGSPAAAAGLRPGDRIVAVDQRPVERIADVRERIAPRYAGDAIEIVFDRPQGTRPAKRLSTTATLVATLPPRRRGMIGVLPEPPPRRGAPGGGEPCPVVVAAVLPGGPAAAAGLAPGDRIEWIAPVAATDEPPHAPEEGRVVIDTAATITAVLTGIEPGTAVELGTVTGPAPRRVRLVAAAPAGDPPRLTPAIGAVAAAGAARADVDVVPLAAVDTAAAPLAVIPRGRATDRSRTERAGGVLVYCGPPRGGVNRAEAEAWCAAAVTHGVAVVLPGSGDPRRWSADDLPDIRRALAALDARWPVDPARIAVAGTAAGGTFAWLLAERLGIPIGGVALVDAVLPRQAVVESDEAGRARWVLMGTADPARVERIAVDRRRLEAAGVPVGSIEVGQDGGVTDALRDTLCGWVASLSLF